MSLQYLYAIFESVMVKTKHVVDDTKDNGDNTDDNNMITIVSRETAAVMTVSGLVIIMTNFLFSMRKTAGNLISCTNYGIYFFYMHIHVVSLQEHHRDFTYSSPIRPVLG